MPYLKTRTDHVDMEKGNSYVNNTSEIKDWVAGIHVKSTGNVITLWKYSCPVLQFLNGLKRKKKKRYY